jgi:predicted ATP-dependent endonuclease of OLD family
MYINSVEIEKYKIFENLKIEFQIPENSKLENGNIVNVVAGVNGSGKTSLLEYLFDVLRNPIVNEELRIVINNKQLNYKKVSPKYIKHDIFLEKLETFKLDFKELTKNSRIIFLPSKMSFEYRPTQQLDTSYKFVNLIDPSEILGNAEFFIKKFIEDKIFFNDENRSNKELKEEAVNEFNSIFENSEFVTKLIDLDRDNNRRPIFQTITGERVTIEKLSSGEQQLYGRVVSLMILNPQNSIILIDEPEIALHPKWQTEIMKIYANIGRNNQFIVTTHSPFIISQTHYKSLIFLVKENEKIVAKQFHENETPPHRDINTLVKTIMGGSYFPKELEDLQNEYRGLFDKEQESSQRGKELEKKILEWEAPNSSFWQSIDFDRELRDI